MESRPFVIDRRPSHGAVSLSLREPSGSFAAESYTYEPYGARTQDAGSGSDSPLQFAGGPGLGPDIYQFGLRHYDAATATFTTPDPAETGETYSYASGNPAVYTDLLGLAPISPGGIPNFDSLLDGGPSRAWDELMHGSVARHTIQGYNYLGGQNSSTALKAAPLDVGITVASIFPIGRGLSIGKLIFGRNVVKAGDGLLSPGRYAGRSIPGDATRKFTRPQRDKLNEIMADTGCHRCGVKTPGTKSGDAIPDHQPPLSQGDGPYRLYPHCKACSWDQLQEIARLRRGGG